MKNLNPPNLMEDIMESKRMFLRIRKKFRVSIKEIKKRFLGFKNCQKLNSKNAI